MSASLHSSSSTATNVDGLGCADTAPIGFVPSVNEKHVSEATGSIPAQLRPLANSLNNVGALLHGGGDYKMALWYYQEAVQVRTEALQSVMRPELKKRDDSDHQAVLRRRCDAITAEERRLRLCHRKGTPKLDLYNIRERDEGRLDRSQQKFSLPVHITSTEVSPQVPSESKQHGHILERESAVTLFNMGLVHHEHANLDKAFQLFSMALKVLPTSADPALAALILNNVAQVQHRARKPQDALLTLAKALHLEQGVVNGDDQRSGGSITACSLEDTIAMTLSLTGRIHYVHGDAEKALELCKETLRLLRVELGDDHIDVASILFNIGLVLRETGELGDALEHCQWFLDAAREKLENIDSNPQFAAALHAIGSMHHENGSVSKAISLFEESVSSFRSANAMEDTLDLADALMSLGRILQDTGRYSEAMEKYYEVLRITRSLNSQDQEGEATVLCNMGHVHHARGELHEALAVYKEVLRLSRLLYGDNDSFVADMLGVIGNVRLEMGDTDNAMVNFANATRLLSQSRGRWGHPPVVPNLLQCLGLHFRPAAAAA